MQPSNLVMMIGSAALLGVMFHPKLRNARRWRATVTPLASIIGSGFLVAGPILEHAAGRLAWVAMLALCAGAYLFGSAMRHNIRHVEGEAEGGFFLIAERASSLTLALAYFISVAYYLNLFAAFGLRFVDVTDPLWIRIGATSAIALIGAIGLLRGLDGLERAEVVAVGLKLAVIGGLLAAALTVNGMAVAAGDFAWKPQQHAHGAKEIGILLGLLILVQGFETSRYLGSKYDKDMRIKTMRWAQILSSIIYVSFVLLITYFFNDRVVKEGSETAIIDILAPMGATVGPLLILAALASQSSAAIADMNGGAGLLAETSGKRLSVNFGNVVVAFFAAFITWSANIYEIVTYASKAFVLYYGLQAAEAAWSAWTLGMRKRAIVFALGVVLAVIVLIFAIPADI